MIKAPILLLAFFAFFCPARADTTDYWHVYYNKLKIRELNPFSKGELAFDVKNIQQTDSLTVYYFRDTPCTDCPTLMIVEAENNVVVATAHGIGTSSPLRVSLMDILKSQMPEKPKIYYVWYLEGGRKILLFQCTGGLSRQ